jgi:hypothetical protein
MLHFLKDVMIVLNRQELRRVVGALVHLVLLPSKLMRCGRAIAQAVIRWLPTAAARVQTRV